MFSSPGVERLGPEVDHEFRLVSRLRINGATPLLLHMPIWRLEGHNFFHDSGPEFALLLPISRLLFVPCRLYVCSNNSCGRSDSDIQLSETLMQISGKIVVADGNVNQTKETTKICFSELNS